MSEEKKQYDCGIAVDNYWFRYRTGAIIIKDEKMLFVRSMFGGYYYMIGGGILVNIPKTVSKEKSLKRQE